MADRPLPSLPPRAADSHKGDFGRALVVGGSRGMAGAIALAGMAALRGGAGLVQLAVPEDCSHLVASFEPSYMTVGLSGDSQGRMSQPAQVTLAELLGPATAVACGPGLGRSDDLTELVGWLYRTVKQPAVFDADALNALAQRPDLLASPGGPRILTPHPGEFRRLIGNPAPLARDLCEREAHTLAARSGIVIVLKGHRTLVTDGTRQIHNTTGNPGMATGGCGDVLTGLLTALLCQQLAVFDAAHLGTHLHGLAGDLAADELGEVSLIAGDLVRFLPAAFSRLRIQTDGRLGF
ncbi:MAG TPA: NAD(P)H-hydrate dehydratase [Pirellulales bacterium]|nr:NAD(P)H-hydrate dehydratase [Pirellulales bacterium]